MQSIPDRPGPPASAPLARPAGSPREDAPQRRWSLTKRLLVLALVAYLPAIAILTYNEFDLRRSREAEVRDLVLRSARSAQAELDRIFEGVENLLRAVGEVPAVRDFDTEACGTYLESLRARVPYLKSLSVLDIAGAVQCQHRWPRDETRYHTRPYFRAALATRRFAVGTFAPLRTTDEGVLSLAAPLFQPSGTFYGVVVAGLDLQWLKTRMAERGLGQASMLTVADREGVIIYQGPAAGRRPGERIPGAFERFTFTDEPGVAELLDENGGRRLVGYLPPAATGNLFVASDLAEANAFSAINRATTRGFAVLLVGLAAALAGAWIAGRLFFQRPIDRLLTTIRDYRAGHQAARTRMRPERGEIETVGAAFDRLLDEAVLHQEEALREADARRDGEKRYRSLIELSPDAEFVVIDGKIAYANSAMYRLLGLKHAFELVGHSALDFVAEDFRPAVEKQLAATEASAAPVEQRWRHTDGSLVDVEVLAAPVPWEGQHAVQIILRDISARKKADERQQILVHELNHRVKNTLATVQSLAHQTLRTALSLPHFRKAFLDRLMSLSATQNLLTQGAWEQAPLAAILRNELGHYGEERFKLDGEDIQLPPRIVMPLGMIVHELATNAAKYGALSLQGGRLTISWRVAADRHLEIEWREAQGPAVVEPVRKGFGTTLVERIAKGELAGSYERKYDPAGFQCRLRIPLPAAVTVERDGANRTRAKVA
jgi:PAS domain S-box-containing protein